MLRRLEGGGVIFSSGHAAILWAWHGQFECLIGRKSDPEYKDSMYNGNISDGLGQAMNIKIWLERAAYRQGFETIHPILLSVLPQSEPINFPEWKVIRVDKAIGELDDMLRKVGWIAEKGCNRVFDGV
jgi:hypothetical protein